MRSTKPPKRPRFAVPYSRCGGPSSSGGGVHLRKEAPVRLDCVGAGKVGLEGSSSTLAPFFGIGRVVRPLRQRLRCGLGISRRFIDSPRTTMRSASRYTISITRPHPRTMVLSFEIIPRAMGKSGLLIEGYELTTGSKRTHAPFIFESQNIRCWSPGHGGRGRLEAPRSGRRFRPRTIGSTSTWKTHQSSFRRPPVTISSASVIDAPYVGPCRGDRTKDTIRLVACQSSFLMQ